MKRDLVITTMREACIARGINPDATGYKTPKQRHLAVDRIIPGVADREAPSIASAKNLGANYHGNARRQYTRGAAATDRNTIEWATRRGEATAAYVAAFCRLNNLKEGS